MRRRILVASLGLLAVPFALTHAGLFEAGAEVAYRVPAEGEGFRYLVSQVSIPAKNPKVDISIVRGDMVFAFERDGEGRVRARIDGTGRIGDDAKTVDAAQVAFDLGPAGPPCKAGEGGVHVFDFAGARMKALPARPEIGTMEGTFIYSAPGFFPYLDAEAMAAGRSWTVRSGAFSPDIGAPGAFTAIPTETVMKRGADRRMPDGRSLVVLDLDISGSYVGPAGTGFLMRRVKLRGTLRLTGQVAIDPAKGRPVFTRITGTYDVKSPIGTFSTPISLEVVEDREVEAFRGDLEHIPAWENLGELVPAGRAASAPDAGVPTGAFGQ